MRTANCDRRWRHFTCEVACHVIFRWAQKQTYPVCCWQNQQRFREASCVSWTAAWGTPLVAMYAHKGFNRRDRENHTSVDCTQGHISYQICYQSLEEQLSSPKPRLLAWRKDVALMNRSYVSWGRSLGHSNSFHYQGFYSTKLARLAPEKLAFETLVSDHIAPAFNCLSPCHLKSSWCMFNNVAFLWRNSECVCHIWFWAMGILSVFCLCSKQLQIITVPPFQIPYIMPKNPRDQLKLKLHRRPGWRPMTARARASVTRFCWTWREAIGRWKFRNSKSRRANEALKWKEWELQRLDREKHWYRYKYTLGPVQTLQQLEKNHHYFELEPSWSTGTVFWQDPKYTNTIQYSKLEWLD